MNNQPDQIDMMNVYELRIALRSSIEENLKLRQEKPIETQTLEEWLILNDPDLLNLCYQKIGEESHNGNKSWDLSDACDYLDSQTYNEYCNLNN